jgi:outer membrane immunogenic protein
MKKILLGTTMFAGLLVAGAAQAADMPLKAPVRQDCCVYANFGGWYIGFNGGGAVVGNDWSATLFDDGIAEPQTTLGKRSFGVFGVHGGWNWQTGQTVLGIEGDWTWTGSRASTSTQDSGDTVPDIVRLKLDSLASVRGRAGVVLGNLMLYGTAGVAWARTNVHIQEGDLAPGLQVSLHHTATGLVGGVGAEWYITRLGPGSLLFRTEYLHYAFGTQNLVSSATFSDGSFAALTTPGSVDVVRAGLSWKFP